MEAASMWTVFKAMLVLLPMVISMVRDGKVKTGAYDEIVNAMSADWDARVKAAEDAAAKDLPDEQNDENNRSRGSGSVG